MEFLRAGAERVAAGEEGAAVMADVRSRYTTLPCVNVKACLIRKMCKPSDEYVSACAALVGAAPPDVADALRDALARQDDGGRRRAASADERVRALLRTLPPRLPPNARALALTRDEQLQCKRLAAERAVAKNMTRERVPGRALLAAARCAVARADDVPLAELALALMLLTGRRECEVLNGASSLARDGEHSLLFRGQAKKRGGEEGKRALRVPTLAPADDVLTAWEALRRRQGGVARSNERTSRRYQSAVGRHHASTPPWSGCRRPHSLRGAYACMVVRLFDHGDRSDAYVIMCVLGHSGLGESLVYSPFHLGDDFGDEPRLGPAGELTPLAAPSARSRPRSSRRSP